MLNGLDLFSGIGGITLALKSWVRPVVYCETDRYAQSVLLSRMSDGDLPRAPIWDDVRTLSKETLGECVDIDIIYGGFPCQDISSAGNGRGMEAGSRSGLFSEIIRLTEEIRPTFLFLENVPAIRTRGLARVLCELTAIRYDCRWCVVSAAELGAPHLRKRWFLLAANSDSYRKRDERRGKRRKGRENSPIAIDDGTESLMAYSDGKRLEGQRAFACGASKGDQNTPSHHWWSIEPDVGRVANGIQFRMDRIKGLGNSVVPAQAREAFMRLIGL